MERFIKAKEISGTLLERIKLSEDQKKYRDYLGRYRGISSDILEDYGMFYVLDEGTIVPDLGCMRDFELTGLIVDGFVRQKERFVFPILDSKGVILGYVGYDYDEDSYKYLMTFGDYANSKSKVFFNMQNMDESLRVGEVIVVEGIFDSVRLSSCGYRNNLALMSTYISDDHIRKLKRFDRVILIPDNDTAGKDSKGYWEYLMKSNGIDYALITIRDREVTKRTLDLETGEEVTYTKLVKDIDDLLGDDAGKSDFNVLMERVRGDFDHPLKEVGVYSV